MMQLSTSAQKAGGSMIRKMFNMALTMENTVSFAIGEPDFTTPQPIIDAACAALQKGMTHYTPNAGIIELRRSIAKYHANNLNPNPETEIIVTTGACEAIELAFFTLVDPGDEVIVVTPAWPNYFGQVGLCNAVLKQVPVSENNNFLPDPEDIKKAITPKTKLIILNSPCNPTGAAFDKESLSRIADVLRESNAYVISDEIYSRLVYDGAPHVSLFDFEGMRDKTIYVSGFSKMFAMTGWRVGYAIGNSEIIRSMVKAHENGASCLPEPFQQAAITALEECQGDVERMRVVYQKRRDIVYEGINAIEGLSCLKPRGAFYAFVNIQKTGLQSEEFCLRLLREAGVVTVPGIGFGEGGEGFARISYATGEENIREGLRRIDAFVKAIRK